MLEVGLRRAENSGADIAHVYAVRLCTGNHGAGAEQHGDDGGGLGVGEFLSHLRQVAADDMSSLVCENPYEFVRRLGLLQRARKDEDAMSVHDKGIENILIDDHDLD